MDEYNGWKNRQTWNVALWIDNDKQTYTATRTAAKRIMQKRAAWAELHGEEARHTELYWAVAKACGMIGGRTPDNIAWTGTRLDYTALDELMIENME